MADRKHRHTLQAPFRLVMATIGDGTAALLAWDDGDDDTLLATISTTLADDFPEIKAAFEKMVKDAAEAILKKSMRDEGITNIGEAQWVDTSPEVTN